MQLTLPKDKSLLASLVALEWDNQDQVLRHHTLPMVRIVSIVSFISDLTKLLRAQTSLVSRALDGYSDPDKRFEIISDLLKYLHTDTVL